MKVLGLLRVSGLRRFSSSLWVVGGVGGSGSSGQDAFRHNRVSAEDGGFGTLSQHPLNSQTLNLKPLNPKPSLTMYI